MGRERREKESKELILQISGHTPWNLNVIHKERANLIEKWTHTLEFECYPVYAYMNVQHVIAECLLIAKFVARS